jgi:hypothetical protein
MQPNTRLEPGLVDNASEFSDPFFGRFTLRPAPVPLELAPGLAKTYSFPTFYADVGCAIAIFLCDYRRALALMPHPSLQPVRMPRGRAVVLLSCYQYRKVLGLAPYNEIAMTIPVMAGRPGPPVLPLVMDLAGKGYYVFSMPVTSLENQIRGTRIWGLPKLVEAIDITVDDEHCTTVARDADGEPYFELSVPTTGKPKRFDEAGILYTLREGRLLRSRTCFAGGFQVRTDLSRLWHRGGAAGRPVLKLGRSPRAEVLRQLEIEAAPFQLRYCPSLSSCFDLPLEDQPAP